MSAAPFFPHFHLPTTVLSLPQLSPAQPRAAGREWVLPAGALESACPELCKQECAHRHFHCYKSDLKFGGDVCTQLSESRKISGKPVIYSTSLLCGFCFLSPSQF